MTNNLQNFTTNDYDEFLSKLHQIIKIDINILNNLFLLGVLNKFFYIEDKNDTISFFDSTSNTYSIPNDICINKYYKYSKAYSFSTYPLYNKNFEIFKNSEAQLLANFSNSVFLNMIITNSAAYHCNIDILIKYNIEDFCDYDLNLLNNSELISFKDYIKSAFYESASFCPEYINKTDFLLYIEDLKLIFLTCTELHLLLDDRIETVLEKFNNLTLKLKKETKHFFERPLLDIEIDDF